jgi:calcineurin-like phosphoesterase family protein
MTLWFYSDPHFGHVSLVKGSVNHPVPARQFSSVEEMGEMLVQRHNALVKPSDHVYCLGDFAMSKTEVARWAPRLHGHKRIILGNHDVHGEKFYGEYFDKVCAMREFADMIFTHIPLAPWSVARWKANVHGHCHEKKDLVYTVPVPGEMGFIRTVKYVNISVENTNYQPVTLEQIVSWVR